MTGAREQGRLALGDPPPRGDAVAAGPRVLTIGHSTRSAEDLVGLLRAHGAALVADVRAFPRSRRHPHFNIETLPRTLSQAGLDYRHFAALGGRRLPRPDSPNRGWREPGFRGFADYMQSADFAAAMADLAALARTRRIALMCAEAEPWRCHRGLIADSLLARGLAVEHILGPGPCRPHRLTSFAMVQGYAVTYPPPLTG